MDDVTGIRDFLLDQEGVTWHDDSSPDSIHFSVDHTAGLTHKALMNEVLQYRVWLLSNGSNIGTKEYKIAKTKPSW